MSRTSNPRNDSRYGPRSLRCRAVVWLVLTLAAALPSAAPGQDSPFGDLVGGLRDRLEDALLDADRIVDGFRTTLERSRPLHSEDGCRQRHARRLDLSPEEREERIVLCVAAWRILDQRLDDAESLLAAARAQFRARGDVRAEAEAELLLANIDSRREHHQDAAAHFERSLKLWRSVGDALGTWVTYYGRGEARHFVVDLPGAAEDFQSALGLLAELRRQEGPLSLQGVRIFAYFMGLGDSELEEASGILERDDILDVLRAVTEASLGDVHISSGRLDAAEETLQSAWRYSQKFHIVDGPIQRLLGDADLRRGRYGEAREHYLGGSRQREGFESFVLSQMRDRLYPWAIPLVARERAISLGRLAAVESVLGDLDAAARTAAEAQALAESLGAGDLVVVALAQQAAIALMRGEPESARAKLGQAEAELEDRGMTTPSWRALVLAERARLEILLQNWERALDLLQQALDGLEPTGHDHSLATLRLLEGDMLAALGRPDLAEAAFDRAESHAQSVNDGRLRTDVWLRRGWLDHGLGRKAEAAGKFSRALDFARESAEPGVLAQVLMALAMAERSQGNLSEAEAGLLEAARHAEGYPLAETEVLLFQSIVELDLDRPDRADEFAGRAAELARRLSMGLREALARSMQAEVARRAGRRSIAIDRLREAGRRLDDVQANLENESLLASFSGNGPASIYRLLVDLLAEAGESDEAWDWAQKARARVFQRRLGERLTAARPATRQVSRHRASARLLENQLAGSAGSRGAPPTRVRELTLDGDRDSLRHRLRSELQTLHRSAATVPRREAYALLLESARPAAISAALPRGSVWLEYFVTGDRVVIWKTDAGAALSTAVQVELPKDFERQIFDLQNQVIGGRTPAERLERMSRWLLDPVLGDVPPDRLVIVPHDVLHDVPFALLPAGSNRRPLVETTAVSLLPSSSMALLWSDQVADSRALVFGDPRNDLAGAREEARSVAELYGVEARLGSAATEREFRHRAGSHRLVHLAAHGRSLPGRNAGLSHIELAPSQGQDGRLEAGEVAELDLRANELVVLSGCETAEGNRTAGDDVTALAHSFLVAGARAVISTSWEIDDLVAHPLMVDLHRELLGGASPDQALRRAQLRAASRGEGPDLWAAFQVVGRGFPEAEP